MRDDQFYDDGLSQEDSPEAAQDRIARIRGQGGADQSTEYGRGVPAGGRASEPEDSVDSPAVARARARGRAVLPAEEPERARPTSRGARGSGARAVLIIGGLFVAGVVIVVAILFASGLVGEGSSLFATATPTPTDTPTPTLTPTATLTPTVPALALPPLTCIVRSGQGCYDYCQDAAHQAECNAARDFLRTQGVDPDAWFDCASPGSGPNVGDPQVCLEQAWRAANP